eukprot:SM000002S05706  [mRNA]  locus=s2:1727395:1729066:+ [translate_table: standard]
MDLSTVVAYFGGYLFLVFIAICLATGLYYIAELVEELLQAIVALHLLLWVVDRLPTLCVAAGVGAHAAYYRLLRTFPYTSLTSTEFLTAIAMLVVSQGAWARYFLRDARAAAVLPEHVLGFLLVTSWTVPFAFFVSLAATDEGLPTLAAAPPVPSRLRSTSDTVGEAAPRRRRAGTLLGLFRAMVRKRDEVLPTVAGGLLQHGGDGASVHKAL